MKVKVKVYVFRGVKCVGDEHWGNFIDYEDTPSQVYERYALPEEVLPQVYESMVNRLEDGTQEWVKSVVCSE